MTRQSCPRDLAGYGRTPPDPRWPGGARIAVQFVLNYEEGAERSVLHGDAGAERFLSEIVAAPEVEGARHMSMESLFDYGARVGVWRIFDLFRRRRVPLTLFAVAMALERNPAVAEAALDAGHEICSHGYRWLDYQHVDEAVERAHIDRAVDVFERLTGERPKGWYTGRTSPNTRRLIVEKGGFIYDADDYSDELPFWTEVSGAPHLVVPYTLDANDMRFLTGQGFSTGEQFFVYLRDSFDTLYEEGATQPRMLSVGLHARIIARPGRFQGLVRFLDHVLAHKDIWLCRRIDIAEHWCTRFPAPAAVEASQ